MLFFINDIQLLFSQSLNMNLNYNFAQYAEDLNHQEVTIAENVTGTISVISTFIFYKY